MGNKFHLGRALITCTIMTSVSLMSCSDNAPQSGAATLLETLEKSVNQGKIMLGHQDATVYGHSWKYESDRSDVYDIVGDHPAVIGWDIGDIEFAHDNNLDGVPFDIMRSEIAKQHERGGINTISWHAYNPVGGTAWDEGEGMVTSILEGGEHFEMFQTRLDRVAEFLSSLRDSNGELIPIIFRPWHEHNGNWFWWGEKWCTHEEYRQLWDMTYKYMQQRGLDNLVWCYMPCFDAEDKAPDVDQYDMVGFDEYPYNNDMEKFQTNFKAKMEMLNEYRTKYGKIITVSETGYEGMGSDDWFTQVIMPMIESEPVSYVLFWRNAWDREEHFFCSYKGHSSEADFRTFVENPQITTIEGVKNLK
ncbi:MAG: glycosyl hydrolase [Rikenellaceae bacterium]